MDPFACALIDHLIFSWMGQAPLLSLVASNWKIFSLIYDWVCLVVSRLLRLRVYIWCSIGLLIVCFVWLSDAWIQKAVLGRNPMIPYRVLESFVQNMRVYLWLWKNSWNVRLIVCELWDFLLHVFRHFFILLLTLPKSGQVTGDLLRALLRKLHVVSLSIL